MATYNGARFLRGQLNSIIDQTVPPDEIVVSDDASSDETLEILRQAAGHSSVDVHVMANAERAGVNGNFGRAIAATTGDVILLADQDDVWARQKVERLQAQFERPEVTAAFSDATLIDEVGQPLGRTLFQSGPFRKVEQRRVDRGEGFDGLLRWNYVTGATFGFRASVKPLALPIPPAGLHDAWIALLASAVGRLSLLHEPLISYRIHGSNLQGVPSQNPVRVLRQRRVRAEFRGEEIAFFEAAAERLKSAGLLGEDQTRALAGKISHLNTRRLLPDSRLRRASAVLRHAPEYWRYARGFRSVLYDILYA